MSINQYHQITTIFPGLDFEIKPVVITKFGKKETLNTLDCFFKRNSDSTPIQLENSGDRYLLRGYQTRDLSISDLGAKIYFFDSDSNKVLEVKLRIENNSFVGNTLVSSLIDEMRTIKINDVLLYAGSEMTMLLTKE